MILKKNISIDLNIFLTIVATLIVIGFIFVYSASSVYALETFGSSHYFIKKQFIGLIIGFVGLVAIQLIPTQFIKQSSPYFFMATLVLTALTLLPGFAQRIHGSSRWLSY